MLYRPRPLRLLRNLQLLSTLVTLSAFCVKCKLRVICCGRPVIKGLLSLLVASSLYVNFGDTLLHMPFALLAFCRVTEVTFLVLSA